MTERPRSSPRYESAADWPSTPAIDGHVWGLGPEAAAEGPSAEDVRRAETHPIGEAWHTDEPLPDEVLDRLAGEAEALDRLERGYAE